MVKKTKLANNISAHFRRLSVILINLLFNHSIVYKAVGFFNKYLHFVESIFLLYPANKNYEDYFVYSWYAKTMKWNARLVGIIIQEKKIVLIYGISALERDFVQRENINKLQLITTKMEAIRALLKAKQKTFAGILPGVLVARNLIKDSPEKEITVNAIIKALEVIKEKEKIEASIKIIVLGGNGFIGSHLIKRLDNAISFDIKNTDGSFDSLVEKYRGNKLILINVSMSNVLKNYINKLWSNVIILNEVYPAPDKNELEMIKTIGITCYHLVGVKGKAYPRFPYDYNGGIPCCASFWSEQNEIVLKRLS
jgi:hypothetical protein